MFAIYCVSLLVELIITSAPLWRARDILVAMCLCLTGFSTTGLLFQYTSWMSGTLMILGIFRMFSLLRIVKRRMHADYLKRAVRRSSLWLCMYHIVPTAGVLAGHVVHTDSRLLNGYMSVVVVVSVLVLLVTLRNIIKMRHVAVSEYYSDKELPTLSVLVPARNETVSLDDMLRTILANNYPKLEVLVLDDSSSDKTPEIIRQFAQDGVRFVPGREPDEHWLPKNLAYEKLFKEASGELLLFAGVDVRLGPETIRALVTTLLNRKKSIISVLPRRTVGSIKDAVIQPMRYWWELALPRRPFNRPAVLSTCWLIKRKALKKLGGFAAVSHAISPEGYFARELVKEDGYSFIRADDVLDVQTRKPPHAQILTAIRMRYPQFRRRPEWVLMAVVVNMLAFLVPVAYGISTLWSGLDTARFLAIAAVVLFTLTHLMIIQLTNPANALVALINLPLAAASELLLTLISMYRYEFGTVEWRGRDITPPVMHVIPHLPPLPKS